MNERKRAVSLAVIFALTMAGCSIGEQSAKQAPVPPV